MNVHDTDSLPDEWLHPSPLPFIPPVYEDETELVPEIKYLKCKFIAILDDQTIHAIRVMVEKGVPYDYIWELAIRECNKFKSPLHQLSFVEEVTTCRGDIESKEVEE